MDISAEVLIASGGLFVAIIAAIFSIKSYVQMKVTTAIAADDHMKRNTPISPYLIEGFSWREEKDQRRCYFAISLTNSSSSPASILKAELHLRLYVKDGSTSKIILQPKTFPLPEGADILTEIQPINLESGSTKSVWLSYEIPAYVTQNFKIDAYDVVFTSGNGVRVSVHQYIMKEIENAKGKS